MRTETMDKWDLIREGRDLSFIEYEEYLILRRIGRLSNRHKRLCERACNEDIPNIDEKIKQNEDKIKDEVSKIEGLSAEFQHDPRGLTAKIYYTKNKVKTLIYYILH